MAGGLQGKLFVERIALVVRMLDFWTRSESLAGVRRSLLTPSVPHRELVVSTRVLPLDRPAGDNAVARTPKGPHDAAAAFDEVFGGLHWSKYLALTGPIQYG